MINYIQSNQYIIHHKDVVDDDIWNELTLLIKDKVHYKESIKQFHKISSDYNIEIKNIIKDFLNYIIHYKSEYINSNLDDILGNTPESKK